MHWLAAGLALIGLGAVAALLLRQPGVILYDWFVTLRARRLSARPGAAAAPRGGTAAPRGGAVAPGEHGNPASLAG